MLIVVESPYRGKNKTERRYNLLYAQACCHYVLEEGFTPFASHLFFPQFLNEDIPEERMAGITGGYEFWSFASEIWFFTDKGWSNGMYLALDKAKKESKAYREMSLKLPLKF